MPGTPATSPRVGAPRYDNNDGVDFAGQVNAVTDAFDSATALLTDNRFFAPGDLKLSAAATPPAGWLVCDGSSVAQATYPALYAALGGIASPYGVSGSNFNLPDLRDRVPVGASGTIARGATGGAKEHTLTTAQIPSHNHSLQVSTAGVTSGATVVTVIGPATTGAVGSTGGGGSHNNMQPYIGVYYLIKT